jgi:ribonuclease-3
MADAGVADDLGYVFRDPALLQQALTHRSHSVPHNERLEFIGDSILNCVIAAEVFRRFPDAPEGDLSRLRSRLVNQPTLAERARELSLNARLLLGAGEVRSGGADRPSMLADAVEALIGAVFLDGGFDAAADVVRRLFGPTLDGIDAKTFGKDPKTALQEWLQARRRPVPEYRLAETSGVAHSQRFRVDCIVPSFDLRTSGAGASRRAAEQEAAQAALERLGAMTETQ